MKQRLSVSLILNAKQDHLQIDKLCRPFLKPNYKNIDGYITEASGGQHLFDV